jgi:hypothetical protein
MGATQLSIPEALALRYKGNCQVFCETGTYKGGSAIWAVDHFERVYTIEGYRQRFDKTAAALAGKYHNLHMIYGDSRAELARVIAPIQQPIFYWLDAHWCGEGAHDSNGDECPLADELNAIAHHPYAAQSVIMIDDARLFTAAPPYPHDPAQWPSYDEIEIELRRLPRQVWVQDDVIIAVPEALR